MPKKTPHPKTVALRGKLLAFNISPKGLRESGLIETKQGLAQLNFPKHGDDTLARSMKVGAPIAIDAELESDDGAHPVYRPSDPPAQTVGKVVRLNHALHGEVNGCHLEDGTFVHLKPDGAKRFGVAIGQSIEVSGVRRIGADAVVIEAKSVRRAALARR